MENLFGEKLTHGCKRKNCSENFSVITYFRQILVLLEVDQVIEQYVPVKKIASVEINYFCQNFTFVILFEFLRYFSS